MSAWSVAGPLKSCSQLIKQGKQKKKKIDVALHNVATTKQKLLITGYWTPDRN